MTKGVVTFSSGRWARR